jgi:PAS domain-containing protein
MRNERTDRPTKPDLVKTAGGFLAGWIGVTLVGLLDWSTGTEISLSILYLLPIGLAVWFGGLATGLIVAAAAAGIWLVLDTFGGSVYSHPWIPYWNAAVRFGFFVLTTVLLHRIRFFNQHLDGLVRKRTAALAAEVEQRQQAETVVRESETRFRQLAENIKEVFWVSDPGKNEISSIESSA